MLCFLILTPTFALYFPSSNGEKFSELWILGPTRMVETLPFDVSVDKPQSVYLGLSNELGELEYYIIYVKFRNQSDSFPDNEAGIPSTLDPIFEYRVFLKDKESWEKNVSFFFENVSFNQNRSLVSNLIIDNNPISIEKQAIWDSVDSGFYYQLFFELWAYNSTISAFEFHNRSVGVWLNMSGYT